MNPAPHADRDRSEATVADIADAFNASYGIKPPTFATDRDHSEARHTPIGCPCDCGDVACVACSKPWPCTTSPEAPETTTERLDRYAEALHDYDFPKWANDAHPDHNRWSWRGDGHGRAHRDQYFDRAEVVMAVADAEQAELRAEVDLLTREARAEAMHAEDAPPCAVCTHLMVEDQIERAEAAEAGRDRARSLAATLEAQLAQVEALAEEWGLEFGEQSEAWRVFGPQTVSIPFVVQALRAILHPEESA